MTLSRRTYSEQIDELRDELRGLRTEVTWLAIFLGLTMGTVVARVIL